MNFAPYQVIHTISREYKLRENSWEKSDYSDKEIQFISNYTARKMESIMTFLYLNLDCILFGKSSFQPFIKHNCIHFTVVLYDYYLWYQYKLLIIIGKKLNKFNIQDIL